MNTQDIKWIENTSGKSPVSEYARVIVKFSDKSINNNEKVGDWNWDLGVKSSFKITHYAVINQNVSITKSYTLQDLTNFYENAKFTLDDTITDFLAILKVLSNMAYRTTPCA